MAGNTFVSLIGGYRSALGWFAMNRIKTLEFDQDFEMPVTRRFLPSTLPRFPRSHDKMYADGGTHFPDRWVFNG